MDVRDYRSSARTRQVSFRLSDERHAELQQLAARHGVSVQVYLEAKAFGEPFHERKSTDRRPRGRQKETLPLTG